MTFQRTTLIAALVLASLPLVASAQSRLLQASANDQVPTRLHAMTAARSTASTLDRTPASLSWALAADASLDARPVVHTAESREYWIDASAIELAHGVALSTTAKGALVRLSPRAENSSAAIDATRVVIRANGRAYTAGEATQNVANADELAAAGMNVPGGTIVFKLADALGAGRFELAVADARGDYLVHVFEPASDVVLELSAERDNALAGDTLLFHARLLGGGTLDQLAGIVRAPGGEAIEVSFTRASDGRFVASVKPDAAYAGKPGLWELHAFGQARQAGLDVQRDARTAFGVAVASARLDGSVAVVDGKRRKSGVEVRIGIDVADASRYQLAGVLYGTASDGQLKPAAMAHSATWLEAGVGSIDLAFDATALNAAGVRAPYELRDLRLVNQADMSLLERRERAAALR